MKNETLFDTLLKTRIAMYELVDLGLMKDDHIDFFEQQILSEVGIDYMVYADWKNWLIVNKLTWNPIAEKLREQTSNTFSFY